MTVTTMEPSMRSVHVLHASATGTAEDVSECLAERLLLHGMNVKSFGAVDSYPIAQLPVDAANGHIFIFVIATCGDGEVPITMRKFWLFIRRSNLPPSILADMRFVMFGLGDRAYVKFNAAARKLSTRLGDLGASQMIPLRLGDDSANGGYDEELLPWTEELLTWLIGDSTVRPQLQVTSREPRIKVQLEEASESFAFQDDKWLRNVALLGSDADVAPHDAVVSKNTVLTNPAYLEDDKEVRHIELDVSEATQRSGLLDYDPGDVVHVMPCNKPSVVDAFFQLTHFDPSAIVHVTASEHKTRFGRYPLNIKTPCVLRDFVSAQLNLTATPRRRFFERLAPFATILLEKEKLLEFASISGAEALSQYSYREKRTILMSLRDFPSARPPLEHLIDIIPVLKSRPFSIASSSRSHRGKIHICASIVKYTTPLRFSRVGVCSSFFVRLIAGDVVPVFLEKGTSLRFDEHRPAILIGPGTGVAPMRSFLFPSGPNEQYRILFFGCRSRRGDFLYEQDWSKLLESKQLGELVPAFSREVKGKKTYVQHKINMMARQIWELISVQSARVYVAGSAGSMPKAIRETLVTICKEMGDMTDVASERFIRGMETDGRLQMECW